MLLRALIDGEAEADAEAEGEEGPSGSMASGWERRYSSSRRSRRSRSSSRAASCLRSSSMLAPPWNVSEHALLAGCGDAVNLLLSSPSVFLKSRILRSQMRHLCSALTSYAKGMVDGGGGKASRRMRGAGCGYLGQCLGIGPNAGTEV